MVTIFIFAWVTVQTSNRSYLAVICIWTALFFKSQIEIESCPDCPGKGFGEGGEDCLLSLIQFFYYITALFTQEYPNCP